MFAKVVAVCLFAALISLPGLQMLFGLPSITPLNENREPAAAPTWAPTAPRDILISVKAWFEDHYGFRPLLIRLHAQINYSIFGVSDRVHIGRNGFLFYRSVLDDEQFAVERVLRERRSDVIDGVRRLQRDLQAEGRQLVLLISPTKDVLYPEMLPRSAPHIPAPTQIELLRQDLARLPSVIYIDPLPVLQRLKKERIVFYRTDAHWTLPAAHYVSKLIIDTLADKEGIPSPWKRLLTTERTDFVGGEATQIPLFVPPRETFEKLVSTSPPLDVVRAGEVTPFLYSHLVKPDSPGFFFPCATVVGDSFSLALQVAGLAEYFRDYSYASWYAFSDFRAIVGHSPRCRYFIYSFVAGNRLALQTLADYGK